MSTRRVLGEDGRQLAQQLLPPRHDLRGITLSTRIGTLRTHAGYCESAGGTRRAACRKRRLTSRLGCRVSCACHAACHAALQVNNTRALESATWKASRAGWDGQDNAQVAV